MNPSIEYIIETDSDEEIATILENAGFESLLTSYDNFKISGIHFKDGVAVRYNIDRSNPVCRLELYINGLFTPKESNALDIIFGALVESELKFRKTRDDIYKTP